MATNPTSIDLTVHFVGECLFVPDGNTDPPTTYVLMPVVPGMPHVAALCIESAYLPAGAPAWTWISMERAVLTIGGGASSSTDVPPGLVDVGALAQSRVKESTYKQGDPQKLLDALVSLTSGAQGGSVRGVCWNVPDPETRSSIRMPITYNALWQVPGIQSPIGLLELTFTPLADGVAPGPVWLVPSARGTVEVWVYHTPESDLPGSGGTESPEPKENSPAPHFFAYYALFEDDTVRGIPTYFGLTCTEAEGGSPFTCLAAASPLSPP
jgi:hypothetical protein